MRKQKVEKLIRHLRTELLHQRRESLPLPAPCWRTETLWCLYLALKARYEQG